VPRRSRRRWAGGSALELAEQLLHLLDPLLGLGGALGLLFRLALRFLAGASGELGLPLGVLGLAPGVLPGPCLVLGEGVGLLLLALGLGGALVGEAALAVALALALDGLFELLGLLQVAAVGLLQGVAGLVKLPDDRGVVAQFLPGTRVLADGPA